MSIVLLETSHSGESGKRSADFVAMEDTEISIADRHVAVGADLVVEHETVARTVHGLDAEAVLLQHLEEEHIVLGSTTHSPCS